ncbi:MAG: zinc-dependent metalloprotease family protein [Cyanobacteria bacterium J06606_4]
MNHKYFSAGRHHFASRLLFVGCAIALSSCTDGIPPSTQTITYGKAANDLYIQPIQVCNDHGSGCADVNLFADITAKILEQARLKVNFLPTNQLHASRFLSIDSSQSSSSNSEFYELSRSGGPGDYGRHPDSTRDSGPINVWFVEEIDSGSGATQFGLAWVDGNGVLISEATQDFNDGEGRIDTLAHEIGHNLGLRHTTFGAGGAENLLTDGNRRNVPSSTADVYPDGAGTSQLTDAQIKEILNSGFLTPTAGDTFDETAADFASFSLSSLAVGSEEPERVPEPGTWLGLSVLGLSILGLGRKGPASQA